MTFDFPDPFGPTTDENDCCFKVENVADENRRRDFERCAMGGTKKTQRTVTFFSPLQRENETRAFRETHLTREPTTTLDRPKTLKKRKDA